MTKRPDKRLPWYALLGLDDAMRAEHIAAGRDDRMLDGYVMARAREELHSGIEGRRNAAKRSNPRSATPDYAKWLARFDAVLASQPAAAKNKSGALRAVDAEACAEGEALVDIAYEEPERTAKLNKWLDDAEKWRWNQRIDRWWPWLNRVLGKSGAEPK
jgi:hypothetical protein